MLKASNQLQAGYGYCRHRQSRGNSTEAAVVGANFGPEWESGRWQKSSGDFYGIAGWAPSCPKAKASASLPVGFSACRLRGVKRPKHHAERRPSTRFKSSCYNNESLPSSGPSLTLELGETAAFGIIIPMRATVPNQRPGLSQVLRNFRCCRLPSNAC